MLSLFLLVEVDGRKVSVTLEEILAFLKEDEKLDFKDLVAIYREDQWRIQAIADSHDNIDMSDDDVFRTGERLAENATCFYLVVKERMKACLRGLDRTMDFVMEGV